MFLRTKKSGPRSYLQIVENHWRDGRAQQLHAERRDWVWAALGHAPLAIALEHLATLANLTAMPLTGATPAALADAYSGGGWCVDAAALAALAVVEKPDDVAAVRTALLAVYKPWLEEMAERFQQAAATQPLLRRPAGVSK